MERIGLRMATKRDKSWLVALDYALDKKEHIELRRKEKIAKAILGDECFIVLADGKEVGFIIFDYRFFDRGWIELIIIEEKQRGKGIGRQAIELICQQSKTDTVFTSTNRSNIQMQKALTSAGFTFAGTVEGLDDGDPELFYCKMRNCQ